MFDLPRSSWADYDAALLSEGGGIYERTAKSITISPEAQAALGTDQSTFTPNELLSTVLRAPVQLLWNGGIGTYVKSTLETDADVGDKSNDAIRVDAAELRCTVIGEGGNLGFSQRGRIEFAQRGGFIFTDAIDNAGGVDCSDHEVNIKILLDRVVAEGDMTMKQRNLLLEEMTDEVADLVLAGNYQQALALTAARIDAISLVDVHARYVTQLEQDGHLDRGIEFLPDSEEFAERRLAGTGLTTPELAVLNAYSKNTLQAALLASAVPDDPALEKLLVEYFPAPLRERFGDRIENHQLRREIIATMLANAVVNRAGVSMIYRLGLETSAPAVEIAAAHFAAWEIYDLESVINQVNALEGVLTVERQMATYLSCRQLAERATRILIRSRPNPFDANAAVTELTGPISETISGLGLHLLGTDRQVYQTEMADFIAAGADEALAERIAGLPASVAAIDIVEVARQAGISARLCLVHPLQRGRSAGSHMAQGSDTGPAPGFPMVDAGPLDPSNGSLHRSPGTGDPGRDHRRRFHGGRRRHLRARSAPAPRGLDRPSQGGVGPVPEDHGRPSNCEWRRRRPTGCRAGGSQSDRPHHRAGPSGSVDLA